MFDFRLICIEMKYNNSNIFSNVMKSEIEICEMPSGVEGCFETGHDIHYASHEFEFILQCCQFNGISAVFILSILIGMS